MSSSNFPNFVNTGNQIPHSQNLFNNNNNSPFTNQNRQNNNFPNNNFPSKNFYGKSMISPNNQPNINFSVPPQNMNPGNPPYVNPNLSIQNYNNIMNRGYNNNNLNNKSQIIYNNNNNFPNYNNPQDFKNNLNNQKDGNIILFQQLMNEKNNIFNITDRTFSNNIINDSDRMEIDRLNKQIQNYNNCADFLITIQKNSMSNSLNFLKSIIVETSLEPDSIEYILTLKLNKLVDENEKDKIKNIISNCKYDLLDHLEYKTVKSDEKSNLKEFIRNNINRLKIQKENEKNLDINGNVKNNNNNNQNSNISFNLINYNDNNNNLYNNNNNQNPNSNNFNQPNNLYNNNNNNNNYNPNSNNFNQPNNLYNNNNYNNYNPNPNNFNQPNNLYNNNNYNNYNPNPNNFNNFNNFNSLNSFEPDKNSPIQIKYVYQDNHQLDKTYEFKYGDDPNEMIMKVYQENPNIENPVLYYKNGFEIKINPNKDKYIGKLFERQPKEIFVKTSK